MRVEFSALRKILGDSNSRKELPTVESSDKKAVHLQRCDSVKRLLQFEELLHEESHNEAMASTISVKMIVI